MFGYWLLIVAFVGVAILLWKFKHALDWKNGVLDGHDAPFDLGETRTVSYRAVAKNARVLEPLEVTVDIMCEEEVYYNQGTDRVRKADDLFVGSLPVVRHPDDLAVSLSIEVYVPPDLPPSLDLRNNNINWSIEVRLDPDSGIELSESFEITVLPQVRNPGSEPRTVRRADPGSEPLPPRPGNFYE